jgi:membrane-associated phospholipid phosphatase
MFRMRHVFLIAALLCGVATVVVLAESAGVRTGMRVSMRGDVARELRWLGQYGQLACVVICLTLIWQLDTAGRRAVVPVLVLVMLATAGATVVGKHLTGRVRPAFENAGRFMGPSLERDASRESFPSGHTSSAVALTVVLGNFYPRLRGMLWALAIACGVLRWIRDAHWLGDVLAGAALGFIIAHVILGVRDAVPWLRLRPLDVRSRGADEGIRAGGVE